MRDYFQASAPETKWELRFVIPNLGFSDLKDSTNNTMEYESKNGAQI